MLWAIITQTQTLMATKLNEEQMNLINMKRNVGSQSKQFKKYRDQINRQNTPFKISLKYIISQIYSIIVKKKKKERKFPNQQYQIKITK